MAESTSSARRRRTTERPAKGETTPNKTAEEKAAEELGIDPPTPTKRSPADRKLAQSIAGTYQAIGMGMVGIGLRVEDQGLVGTGTSTVNQSEVIAEAWLSLADKNPQVKKALRKFTEVSAAGTLIGLHITLLIPILVDRNVIPPAVAVMADGMATGMNGNGSDN